MSSMVEDSVTFLRRLTSVPPFLCLMLGNSCCLRVGWVVLRSLVMTRVVSSKILPLTQKIELENPALVLALAGVPVSISDLLLLPCLTSTTLFFVSSTEATVTETFEFSFDFDFQLLTIQYSGISSLPIFFLELGSFDHDFNSAFYLALPTFYDLVKFMYFWHK